jgi:glutaredoxin
LKVVWKVVRWVLGIVILTLDTLIRPKSIKRSSVEQQKLNKITSSYSIYQFKACPFCVKVRRQVRKFGLEIEFKDAKNNKIFKEELVLNGGRHKVPCLRIDSSNGATTWLYESKAIISFLKTELKLV